MLTRHATTCSNGEPGDYKVGTGTRQVRGVLEGLFWGMACAGLSKSDGTAHHVEKNKRLWPASCRTEAVREAGLPTEFVRRRCTRWWWTRQCSWLGGGAFDWNCPRGFPTRRPWRAVGTTHLVAAGSSVPERICPVQVSRGQKKSGRTWWCPRPRRRWSPPTGTTTAGPRGGHGGGQQQFWRHVVAPARSCLLACAWVSWQCPRR